MIPRCGLLLSHLLNVFADLTTARLLVVCSPVPMTPNSFIMRSIIYMFDSAPIMSEWYLFCVANLHEFWFWRSDDS